MTLTTDNNLTVSLTPAPEAAQGQHLLTQANRLVVVDKTTHEACRQFTKDVKALKRTIEAHYDRIKRPLTDAKNTVLQMEREHLAPLDQAIKVAERLDIDYVNAERARADAEAARQREENERLAREQRAAELAKAEAEAEALEATAADLSEREQIFVEQFVACNDSYKAAKRAGYKNPEISAGHLLGRAKIQKAIEAHRAALMIRLQADEVSQQPLDVAPVVVETAVASVAGTSLRTYYSCGDVDVLALCKSILLGLAPVQSLQPNTVFLNKQASALKDLFPKAFPGCQLAKKQGISG